MHRIDAPGNVANQFVDPDASIGQEGTICSAAWLNEVQEELCTVIEANGGTPTKGQTGQVAAALQGRGFYRNRAMNGTMRVAQRIPLFTTRTFFGVSAQAGFVLDRWHCDPGDLGTCIIRHGDLDLLTHNGVDQAGLPLAQGKIANYLIWDQTTTSGIVRQPRLTQRLPDVRNLAGEEVTISFYGRLAMAPDPGLNQFKFEIVQDFGTGGSPSSPVVYQSPTFEIAQVFTTWNRYSFTTTLGAMQGKAFGTNDDSFLKFGLVLGDGGETFTLHATGFQIEVGSAASAVEFVPFEVELLRCQAFYQQSYTYTVEAGTVTEVGSRKVLEKGATPYALDQRFRAEMARVPDVTWYSPSAGTVDRIDWNGSVETPAANVGVSRASTGHPGATSHGANADHVSAHWTAEAEF